MQPKVSIIVPAYNSEQYLRVCLESIANQALREIEIVCVNDGSTDGSLAIMTEFAQRDDRFIVIDKANAGYGAAINDGIDAARGEYIGIVESDDYITSQMYTKYYGVAKKYGDLDVVKSDFRRFWGEGDNKKFELVKLSKDDLLYNKPLYPKNDPELFDLYILMQSGIYRRDFLLNNNIRLNESPGASYQDNGFRFQVFALAETAMILHEAYYMLRRDNPDSSINSTGKVYCICDEYDFIRNFVLNKKNELHPDLLKVCARLRFNNYRHNCERVAPKFKREFAHRFGEDFKKLYDAGELDPDFFSMTQWGEIMQVMHEPDGYYYRLWMWYPERRRCEQEISKLKRERDKFKKELDTIKTEKSALQKELSVITQSRSYRVSRMVAKTLFRMRMLPGKIKGKLANNTQNGEKLPGKVHAALNPGCSDEIAVSVIIPVYNAKEYLCQCLDSVIAQTLRNIEIICVDDGSTDGSTDILHEYAKKDGRLCVIEQKNSGAAVARNAGIRVAKGKYLSILDSDDFFAPNMLEAAVESAERYNSDFVVFRSDQYHMDTKEFTSPAWVVRMNEIPSAMPFSYREITGNNVFKTFVGWAWDKLYRRTFVLENNLWFQEQRTTNDMLFVFSALVVAKRISVVDKVLAHQRRNAGGSLSVTREKSWQCFYNALAALRQRLRDEGIYDELEQSFVNYALHASLWNLNSLAKPTHTMLLEKLRNEWFEDLGIKGRNRDYFFVKAEYDQYVALIAPGSDCQVKREG